MSSNAFARSRPRVRHQRVPKSQSYNHPRFLQLCKELTRLDELKRNQEESDDCGEGSNDDSCATTCPTIIPNGTVNDCPITTDPNSSNYRNDNRGLPVQPVSGCASMIDNFIEAHSSNGFRSLDCTSTARYDEFYQHANSNITQNHHYPQDRCGNNLTINQRHYHLPEPNQLNNTSSALHHSHLHSHQLPTPSCPSKFAPMSTHQMSSSLPRVEQSKMVAPPHGSDFTPTSRNNDSLDLNRQDENRAKRKRSSNDTSSSHGSKKLSSANGSISPSCVASCKRRKSSPEPVRPLSPSFTKCPICLLDCMDRDPSFTNTCFHLFCYVCIENWSKSKATCPLCRTKFGKIIYNIKSAGCFDEKIASPIRRDDDEDRIIYEHMLIASNPMVASHQASRNQHPNDTSSRLTFENIRTSDVLMPPFPFVNSQIDYQPLESLHPFNTTSNSNNSSLNTVPHTSPFSNYNPYITLIPAANPSARLHQPATNTAITSAYAANPGTASLNSVSSSNTNDSSSDNNASRLPRMSRSGRYVMHPRGYNLTTMNDSNSRSSRSSNSSIVPGRTSITLERHHYHAQPHNQQNRHSVVVGVSPTVNLVPRSTSSAIEVGTLASSVNSGNSNGRQSGHRTTLHPYTSLPYSIANIPLPLSYSRQPYSNMPVEQHLFNSIYGASQEPM